MAQRKRLTAANYELSAKNLEDLNPEVVRLAANLITIYSKIELAMCMAYANLVGGNKSEAARLFGLIRSKQTQFNAMTSAAKAHHANPEIKYLQDVLAAAKGACARRNTFAHGIWYTLDSNPDQVAVVDARESAADSLAMLKEQNPDVMITGNRRTTWVYSLAALRAENEKSKRAFQITTQFCVLVAARADAKDPTSSFPLMDYFLGKGPMPPGLSER